MKSDLVDLKLVKIHETDAALLVAENEDGAPEVWLPKSQVEFVETDQHDRFRRVVLEVTMPEKLAIEKELI